MGTAFLLNGGLALESSPTEWEAAEALQLLMVFSEQEEYRFVGEQCQTQAGG